MLGEDFESIYHTEVKYQWFSQKLQESSSSFTELTFSNKSFGRKYFLQGEDLKEETHIKKIKICLWVQFFKDIL